MSQYFRVSPKIWTEPWDDDTRQMAFYVLTNPHRSTEGLHRLPMGYIREDLGWADKKIRPAMATLLNDNFIEYDEDKGVILIVKALKWQPPKNPNTANKAASVLETVPATKLDTKFGELAQQWSEQLWTVLLERFGDRFGEPLALALAPAQAHPHPQSTTGDDDVDAQLRQRLKSEGFEDRDVDATLSLLADRVKFGGSPVTNRLAWSRRVVGDLAARAASSNGGPTIAEIDGERFELRGEEWVVISA
jgi:hypothetical protein